MKTRLLISGALALASIGIAVGPAHADPRGDGIDVQLTCLGEVYDIVVGGNGDWSPAHDLNSTLVGVPIAFGEFNGTFTPTEGEPESFTEPAFTKRNVPRSRNLIIECTYTASGSFPDGTVSGEGSVTILVPRIQP